MERFAETVIVSWGWRRAGWAFAAGALSALAQPPYFLFPVLWLTFPVLVLLLDGAAAMNRRGRPRRLLPGFATGWWFGFGYFLAGLWWIGAAFLVEAKDYAWMLPFAVLGLPAGLALFWGAAAAVAQALWSDDWRRIFALAFAFGGAEWLRGIVLTGFPWNAIGYALTAGEAMMQSAALLGLHGLGFLAVAIFAAPAALIGGARGTGRIAVPAFGFFAVAGLAVFGLLRLGASGATPNGETPIRIVQPAIDLTTKWLPSKKDAVFRTYLDLSAEAGAPLPRGALLVWPESAFPFALTEEPEALAAIAGLLPPETALVTGGYRQERLPDGRRRTFNSVYLLDAEATIVGAYDKVHLVPFGEYVPLAALLEAVGLKPLAGYGNPFSAGTRRQSLIPPVGPPFAPLICYEIIFPGAVLPEGPRPGFLINVTNDTWFGDTPGPYQHYHQARVRAVEEGLALVRAANSGISAVIDPYGRVLARTRLGERKRLDSILPRSLERRPFAAARPFAAPALMLVALILSGAVFLYPRRLRRLT